MEKIKKLKNLGKIFLLILIFLFVFSSILFSKEINVSLSANKTNVDINDDFNIIIEISASGFGSLPEPEIPNYDFCTVIGTSESTNFSMINGNTSITKTYILLMKPNKKGKFTYGPIIVKYKNNIYKSNTLELVFEGKGNPSSSSGGINIDNLKAGKNKTKDTFILTSVDKKTAYIGEPIILTFSFFTRINFWDSPQYKAPETPGFWKEDLKNENKSYRKNINGITYSVQDIKYLLFPTSAGKKTIGPAELSYTVSSFFGPTENIKLETDPITLNILPLPEKGKPDNFSGIVTKNKISLKANLSQGPYKTNQGITLTITINGENCNLNGMNSPKVSCDTDIRIFDPEVKTDIERWESGIKTTKIFKYLIIPQFEGKQTIKISPIHYFNTTTMNYESIMINDLAINVEKGSNSAVTNASANTSDSKPIAMRSKLDINFIKNDVKDLKNYSLKLFDKYIILLILLGIIIFSINLYFVYVIYPKYYNITTLKATKAYKEADRKIKNWFNKKGHCSELRNIIIEYLSDKFNITAQGLLLEDLCNVLKDKYLEKDLIDSIYSIINEIDLLSFSNMQITENDKINIMQKIKDLLYKIDKR